MVKLVEIFLVSLALASASAQLKKKCRGTNIRPQKCGFSNGAAGCIPKVTGVTFNWDDVKPRSFIVSWNRVASAKCYYLEVLTDDTSFPYKTVSCFKGTVHKVTGLTPWQHYGFRVSVVNRRCRRGRPSSIVRIKTFWAPTVATTRTPRPTYSPKVAECGKRRFTCHSNKKECIPGKKWCDRILHCTDGSDERSCPGGCREIKVNFKNGNYSCSRWGSPGSFCFFDCKEPYTRDGPKYTNCDRKRRKWSNPLPVCRLRPTRILKVLYEETTETSVTVEWEPVDGAAKYAFQAIEQVTGDKDQEFMKTDVVNSTLCCKRTISGLMPKVEYRISMWALNDAGLRGIESLPVFFKTVTHPQTVLKRG